MRHVFRGQVNARFLVGKREWKRPAEDLHVEETIILKRMFIKQNGGIG
jgi:hypothetical protein